MLPSIPALTLKSDSLSIPSFPHDSFQSYGGCWCVRPLTVLLLLKNKPFSWPPGSEKGWSDHGVWTNARITCIYSTCFHQLAKGVFFFFLVIFISSPGKQKDKKPTAGWLFKPSLLRHLFKFPETDTDVLHHLHFKCVWVSPEAGSTARGCDQTSITGKRHEQANIRLPGSSRMKKHTSVTVEASLKHSWGALSLL